MILYQFPLSHYCEKVRWALDYKNIPFQKHNLIPGVHLLVTKRLAPKTSVPILVDGKKVIQDSTRIIDYLDENYPEVSMTPSNENLKKEALELEEYFDKNVGVHLRRFIYFYVLEDRPLVISALLKNAPWYGPPLYAAFFPLIKKLMKKTMNIYEKPTQDSIRILDEAIDFLNQKISKQEFLVGNKFSRADLAACALLGPLCSPPEYDFEWPEVSQMPVELQKYRLAKEKEPFFEWVLKTYKEYRKN